MITRREFIQATAAAGVLAFAPNILGQTTQESPLRVGIVGIGRHGKTVLESLLKVPNIEVASYCDIWAYSRSVAQDLCEKYGCAATSYDDYHDMISTEKLDAVVIATPDHWHARMTNDCLNAGIHVYCEKVMARTVQEAASMVRTARKTGKLLQIGNHRRSSPYYLYARYLLHEEKYCGRVTTVYGQWHQGKPIRPLPNFGQYPSKKILEKWEYASPQEFYEWRWFNKFGGETMTDLGGHQLDSLNWFLESNPTSVMAAGDNDYALAEAKANNVGFVPETYDRVLSTYEWNTKWGRVRGVYSVNYSTTFGYFYESIMGTRAAMKVSDIPFSKNPTAWDELKKEDGATWLSWEEKALRLGGGKIAFDPLNSRRPMREDERKSVEYALSKSPYELHLRNFFDAIRSKCSLNCPAETGYASLVTTLKANESILSSGKVCIEPEEYKV